MNFTKFITCAFALSLGLSAANAQQLPNADFETWVDCVPWNSSNTTTKQGVTPENWCVSNVVTPGMSAGNVSVSKKVEGYESESAVNLFNLKTAGQVIPGYLTMGTTWATARIRTATVIEGSTDGGSWGGYNEFTSTPDALSFYYTHQQGNGSTQPATVVGYIWKGETSQVEVPAENSYKFVLFGSAQPDPAKTVTMINRDRNILGMETLLGGEVTKSEDFALIATIDHKITDVNEEWASLEIPFTYVSDETPASINLIFSAGDYFADRSAHKEGDALTVDNVRLVYYSRLSAITVNGAAIEGFESTKYEYTLDTPFAADLEVEATVLGKSAKVEKSVDGENYTVTFTVSNIDADNDGEKTHTYVVKFAEPAPVVTTVPVAVESADYKGSIFIYVTEDPAVLVDQLVSITGTGLGTCDFALDHFSLDGTMDMGNIRVTDVKTTKEDENSDVINYVGSATGIVLKLTETENIYADVDIEGKEDSEHNLEMNIHVKWIMSPETIIPIEVVFNGRKYDGAQSGINTIEAANEEAARYFLINGVEVKDASAAGLYIVRKGNKVEKVIVK